MEMLKFDEFLTHPDIEKTGVYFILCIENNKMYIGSTSESFRRRFHLHKHTLIHGTHKNAYLQHTFNKYGIDSFRFVIQEITLETLEREQVYIDEFGVENLLNINPIASGTPNMSEETLLKRKKTFTIFVRKASKHYESFKNKEISFEDIPEKYKKIIKSWMRNVPWNKGLKIEDTSYLKVPKKVKGSRENFIKTMNEKSNIIEIYDLDCNKLYEFNSPNEAEEWSKTDVNDLPVKSRFGKMRMGIPEKHLPASRITKACKTGEPYKGLYFVAVPK